MNFSELPLSCSGISSSTRKDSVFATLVLKGSKSLPFDAIAITGCDASVEIFVYEIIVLTTL